MKVLKNILLLSLVLPFAVNAGRLIYPENLKGALKSGTDLQSVSNVLGLGLDAGNFQLKEIKESLLGKHYYYQQIQNGYDVEGAEVVVSISHMGEILKVYDNSSVLKISNEKARFPLLSERMALQAAWNSLMVDGELLVAPVTKLVYLGSNLVYQVNISTSSPFGHYKITVDAHTGRILSTEDAALPRMKRAEVATRLSFKKLTNLDEALNKISLKNRKAMLTIPGIKRTNGTAQVFDPNPVVTLGRSDLSDSSPASEFTHAYKSEDLLDISFSNGVYELNGPKAIIADFESPSVAPSTSTDGSWIFERGKDAFTDAMTYLHIDRSIRYMESLGFTGSKVIFEKALEVDANGLGGADNSHYIPYSKRLAFGHGCVDDNEDSDVILHELGHAIQDHIVRSWSGGDTGAMGEGFGDYWASSYSYGTEGGRDTNLNWVFKWDGHNDCWPGRVLNATNLKYDSSRTYYAHTRVGTGQSDEMWSTPLFQAFLELMGQGAAHGDIDKIILEAHFGLGSGVKMPDVAKAIVKAAKALFPSQDYDQVYTKHFKNQNILP